MAPTRHSQARRNNQISTRTPSQHRHSVPMRRSAARRHPQTSTSTRPRQIGSPRFFAHLTQTSIERRHRDFRGIVIATFLLINTFIVQDRTHLINNRHHPHRSNMLLILRQRDRRPILINAKPKPRSACTHSAYKHPFL